MAAGPRLVVQTDGAKINFEGCDAIAVHANSDADAIAVAQSLYDGDTDAAWANAVITTMAAGANMLGWRFHVKVTSALNVTLYDVTVVGAGSDDTIDEIAALMVIALEAAGGASLTPSYNSGTQVLTIATIGDGIGDAKVVAEWFAPSADVKQNVAVPGFVVSKVDGGVAGAVLTATLAADAYSIPKVYGNFRAVR